VQMLFSPLPSSIEYIRTGRLRALATTGAARSGALPDTPIVGDSYRVMRRAPGMVFALQETRAARLWIS
jgi:tripartite-type tricarboxylate transporter receptor subunit TctC